MQNLNARQQAAIVAADHLVGNLWFNPAAVALVAAKLKPAAMPDTPAAVVYGVMCDLLRNPGSRLTAGAVESALRTKQFDFGYLDDLQARILPESEADLVAYTVAINDAADLRQADYIAAKLQALVRKGEEPAEAIIARTLQELTTIRDDNNQFQPLPAIAESLLADVEAWRRGEVPDGLETGFASLDRIMRLRNGELAILAARPSMGKSALAFQIADNVSQKLDAGCVAIFSAEMNRKAVGMRIACAIAGVNSHHIRQGQASPAEYQNLQMALRELRRSRIHIDDSGSPTTDEMFFRASMLHAQNPIRLLIFDYMELGGNSDPNEVRRVGMIAKGLKNIAKALDIPVLALSQLSRGVEERTDKMPSLSDLRFSGDIEAVADLVVFLLRPEYYISRGQSAYTKEEAHKIGVAYAIVAKQRNGPIGLTPLAFVEKHAKFGELAR